MSRKILILAPYPKGTAPSQRFRFEQYLHFLEMAGYQICYCSFYSYNDWNILYNKGSQWRKLAALIKGYFRRTGHLAKANGASYVLLHREATPFGPPVFEWIITRILRKKLIYDFDDAIYLGDERKDRLRNFFKMPSKVEMICKWSYCISPGNEELAKFARQFNENVEVLPTVVGDNYLEYRKETNSTAEKLVIGWTGSHSTLKYLDRLVPVIKKLEAICSMEFRVIANKDPRLPLKSFRYIPWSRKSEVEDLAKFDIGIMPLEDNEWTRGKCGFKAIQYLALNIPAVVSPVGVNRKIVDEGVNGLFAVGGMEWYDKLYKLVTDQEARLSLSGNGREKVRSEYSKKALLRLLPRVFKEVSTRPVQTENATQ